MISTPRLRLMPFGEAHFQAVFNKDLIALGELLDVETPEKWTTFHDVEDALPFLYDSFKEVGTPWFSYFIVHKIDRQLLGTCGFKGKPDKNGVVEIGYEIKEEYRFQGLATEAAKGLVDTALQTGEVTKVIAHTLAHMNPSVSVLKKLGFVYSGQLIDDYDGDVWCWELER